jgi:hypothetical protein
MFECVQVKGSKSLKNQGDVFMYGGRCVDIPFQHEL